MGKKKSSKNKPEEGAAENAGQETPVQAPADVQAPAEPTPPPAASTEKGAKERARKLELLREAAVVLEEVSTAKAPANAKEHPFDTNRGSVLKGMRVILGVLGREKDAKETPASAAELDDAIGTAAGLMGGVRGATYSQWEARARRWLAQAEAR